MIKMFDERALQGMSIDELSILMNTIEDVITDKKDHFKDLKENFIEAFEAIQEEFPNSYISVGDEPINLIQYDSSEFEIYE